MTPRVAVICDYVEEGWLSMDLFSQMLLSHLAPTQVSAARICPLMRRSFGYIPILPVRTAFNADRLINRFWLYPRRLRALRAKFDVFHVIDHSYAQLVHELPGDRTVVTCHDLDAFRCLLDAPAERRSPFFRILAKRVLSGLQKAARIVCVSEATRADLVDHGLVRPERVSVVPNGVPCEFRPDTDPAADADRDRLLGESRAPEFLHVGSTIGRKRIDVLLRVFAGIRRSFRSARLIRVGGAFTPEQEALVEALGLNGSVIVLPFLERAVLASVYRRATAVLLPSEREGFGFPVIEALACGTPVIASSIPALREVGGDAAIYCPVGEVAAWTDAAIRLHETLLADARHRQNTRSAAISQASHYSWTAHASAMTFVYSGLFTA